MEHSFELLFHLFSCFLITIGVTGSTSLVRSNVELKCRYQATSSDKLLWVKVPSIAFSSNDQIYLNSYPDIKRRVTITGNHVMGEYHLSISDVQKTDAGTYECIVRGNKEEHQLTVIEGPQSVSIARKTQDNKLVGTEDQDLTISCTAVGGDPVPDMVLQIRNQNYTTRNSPRTIQLTIPKVGRSSDGGAVTCLAGYQSISHFPVNDTATVYLHLKPSIQSLSPDPVVTVETKPLTATCISAGGRPKPTVKWTIDNVDITTHSTEVSSTHDTVTDTHTVTSTLTYIIDRNYNGKTLSCGFKNEATGNSYVSMTRNLDVKFSPSVSVGNETFNPSDISRQVSCTALGNPADYTYFNWQHKSKYGNLIRILYKNSTLTLPPVTKEKKYQDTGEYICTVSNGIKDRHGNMNQQGSGFVTSHAPPVILSGLNQTNYGQLKGDVQIHVNVYSEPTYTSLKWLKRRTEIISSSKYIMTDVPDVMTDTFHGTKVQVDGYKLTLTIHDLEVEDFVNYTLSLSNGVGQTVEHSVILKSASSPETPTEFTLILTTKSAIILQWLSGFGGGHEQTFVVEYRIAGFWNWNKVNVSKTLKSPECDLHIYTLLGLGDGTLYEIRVYAENIFNKSIPTNIVEAMTKSLNDVAVERSTMSGLATGLLTVLAISVIINIVLTLKVVRGKYAKTKSQNSEQNIDVYDNITESQAKNTNIQTYETLGSQEKPSVYEALGQQTGGPQRNIYTNTVV